MSRAEVEADQDNVEVRCVPACALLSCLAAALLGQVHSHQSWRDGSANVICSSTGCSGYICRGSDGLHCKLLAVTTIWQGCIVSRSMLVCRTLTTMTQTSAALKRGETTMQVCSAQLAAGTFTSLCH